MRWRSIAGRVQTRSRNDLLRLTVTHPGKLTAGAAGIFEIIQFNVIPHSAHHWNLYELLIQCRCRSARIDPLLQLTVHKFQTHVARARMRVLARTNIDHERIRGGAGDHGTAVIADRHVTGCDDHTLTCTRRHRAIRSHREGAQTRDGHNVKIIDRRGKRPSTNSRNSDLVTSGQTMIGDRTNHAWITN